MLGSHGDALRPDPALEVLGKEAKELDFLLHGSLLAQGLAIFGAVSANMEIVGAEWRARTLAEYRSASVAAEFLSWMVRLGFSSENLQVGYKLLGNEFDHADMSWEVYQSLGAEDDPLDVPEATLVIHQAFGRPTFERLVLTCLDVYCIGETIASDLWAAMQQGVAESGPSQTLARIAADVPGHIDFGWSVLDEALERDAKAVKALAKKHLPAYFARAERAWGRLPETWVEPVGPHELRYGLIPRARYKREFFQTIAERVLPKLDDRELQGRSAWGRRPKEKKKK